MKNDAIKTLFLSLIAISLIGCSAITGPYGTIFPDDGAQKSFDAFRMEPNMNYYYSGPDLYPNAVIGIKKEFVLDNDLWKPIETTPKEFKKMLVYMQEKALQNSHLLHGFAIKDHQGKAIGIWYSILSIQTMVVKMGEGNKVVVFTPELIIFPTGGGAGPDQPGGR